MHTQNRPILKKFLLPFTCLNREMEKWGCFEKKIKSPFTCLKQEMILGGVFFEKIFIEIFENKKSPPDSSNREENVVEKILNCELLCGNSENTVCISTLNKRYLLGRS